MTAIGSVKPAGMSGEKQQERGKGMDKLKYSVVVDSIENKQSKYLKIELKTINTTDQLYLVYLCFAGTILMKSDFFIMRKSAIKEAKQLAAELGLGVVEFYC
jgi:hypothetical protein